MVEYLLSMCKPWVSLPLTPQTNNYRENNKAVVVIYCLSMNTKSGGGEYLLVFTLDIYPQAHGSYSKERGD